MTGSGAQPCTTLSQATKEMAVGVQGQGHRSPNTAASGWRGVPSTDSPAGHNLLLHIPAEPLCWHSHTELGCTEPS